jgi:hypothetical protein
VSSERAYVLANLSFSVLHGIGSLQCADVSRARRQIHNRKLCLYIIYIRKIGDLCSLVVGVPGCRSRGPGSIPGTTKFSEKYWIWNGVHSASSVQLRSYLKEKVAAPV